MALLTKHDLLRMEDYYYWSGHKDWIPFPKELKDRLMKTYGQTPDSNTWSEQDIHEGTRKIILNYFKS